MLKSVLNTTVLVALLLCLVTATISFGGILPDYTLPLYGFVALLASVWAVKLFCCRHVQIPWSPVHVPVLLFAGYALARYAMSPIEHDSRIELLHVALYTLVYFAAAGNFFRSRDFLIIVSTLVAVALGESIYGLWQYGRQADAVLWLERGAYHGRASGTFFCPNHLAGLLEMALCLLVAHLLVNRAKNAGRQTTLLTKLYELAAAVLVGFGLFATLSRGGWFSAAIALLVLLVWAEVARVVSSRFAVTIFAGLVLTGIVAWNIPKVRDRIEQDVRFQLDFIPGDTPIQVVSGLAGRYPIWRATLNMIQAHPWWGTGPGTWQWFHLQYRDPHLQIHPQFAHNDVLQLVSDYGLVGLALIVAAFAGLYWHARRVVRQSDSPPQKAFVLGAAAAATALLVHSFGDFNLHIPANTLWLVTLVGLTIAQSPCDDDPRRRELHTAGRVALGLAVLVIGLVISCFGVRQSQCARYTALGYDANQRFEWDEAHAFYQHALSFDASDPQLHAQIGDAYRMQSAVAESPELETERHRLALLAVDAYRQSLALNAFQSEVMLRLAAAYELAGNYNAASQTYAQAVAVDPNNAFNWLRIGMYYRRRGDLARAVEALQFSQRLNNFEPIASTYLQEIKAEQSPKP